MLPPVRNVPLSTQIADQLRERIAGGELPVGSRLPTESELAAELGVSRNSVREATRSLVHSGLLSSRPGDGTYVVAASELAPALQRSAGRCRAGDVMEVRMLLERFAASRAAERATAEDLARMRAALDARDAAPTAAEHVAADVAFHRAVLAASGNALAAELYGGLHEIEEHIARTTPEEGFGEFLASIRALNEAHRDLYAAIERGDAGVADGIARDLVAEAHSLAEVGDAAETTAGAVRTILPARVAR